MYCSPFRPSLSLPKMSYYVLHFLTAFSRYAGVSCFESNEKVMYTRGEKKKHYYHILIHHHVKPIIPNIITINPNAATHILIINHSLTPTPTTPSLIVPSSSCRPYSHTLTLVPSTVISAVYILRTPVPVFP